MKPIQLCGIADTCVPCVGKDDMSIWIFNIRLFIIYADIDKGVSFKIEI